MEINWYRPMSFKLFLLKILMVSEVQMPGSRLLHFIIVKVACTVFLVIFGEGTN